MRINGPEKFLIVASLILFGIGVLSYIEPQIGIALNNAITGWIKGSLGSENLIYLYIIAMVSVIIANASVFIYIPYPIILFSLAAKPEVNLIVLIIVSSIGAAIGELSSYLIGFIGKKAAEDIEKYRKKAEAMRRLLETRPLLVPFIVFFMALTPLPDDVILIPLGFVGYSLVKSVIACFLGKFVLITVIILGGRIFGEAIIKWLTNSNNTPYPWLDDIIILYIVVIIIYVILKIDFTKIAAKLGISIEEEKEES
ncbi:MAG: VTT domain-containing protein [Candidatus Njordarchaeales archaeon]